MIGEDRGLTLRSAPTEMAISKELFQPYVDVMALVEADLRCESPPAQPEPVASFSTTTLLLGLELTDTEIDLLSDSRRCLCGHLNVLHNTDDVGDTCPLCDCTEIRR